MTRLPGKTRMTAAEYLDATPEPKEDEEQRNLFRWAELMAGKYPELGMMYHIPNGGSRRRVEAAILKGMGVKKGVPDVCLPVAAGPYHGMYIEMKRSRSGKPSPEQTNWLEKLTGQGYKAALCHGWREASEAIEAYLEHRHASESIQDYLERRKTSEKEGQR